MILFPAIVLKVLILGALAMTGLGFVTLLVLIFRDTKNRSIW